MDNNGFTDIVWEIEYGPLAVSNTALLEKAVLEYSHISNCTAHDLLDQFQ